MKIRLSTFIYLVRLMPYNIKNNNNEFDLKLDVPVRRFLKRLKKERNKEYILPVLIDYDNKKVIENINKKIKKEWLKKI